MAALFSLSALAAPAPADRDPDFEYREEGFSGGSRLIITKYVGPGGEVVIPGYVYGVDWDAFWGNDAITGVTISEGVRVCSHDLLRYSGGFGSCANLTRASVPASLGELWLFMFANCPSLTEVTLAEGLTGTGRAFAGCTGLTAISLPKSMWLIDTQTFKDCTSLTWVNMQNGVRKIWEEAFAGCTSLREITLPNTVDELSRRAFRGCTALERVTLSNSITKIQEQTFLGCSSLTMIAIPDSVTSIGQQAFEGCTSLTAIAIPPSVTEIKSPFSSGSKTAIYCEEGSAAEAYAKKYGHPCRPLAEFPVLPPASPLDPAQAGIASQSALRVDMDGAPVQLQAYALMDDLGGVSNYVKIRDVAAILDGTPVQFNVGWADGVNIEKGRPYTSRNGQENSSPYSGDRPYTRWDSATFLNGSPVSLQGFVLYDDLGSGSTYYKLRDLGAVLNFNVGWEESRGIYIETDKPYDPAN